MLGLETKDAGWSEEDGKKEDLAMRVQELLLEKADMMKEYFSIVIDKNGNLKSLPILLGERCNSNLMHIFLNLSFLF